MYRVEFYKWSGLIQRYELVRTYWTDAEAADKFIAHYGERLEKEDVQVYQYRVYITGQPVFVLNAIAIDVFPVYTKDALL